MKLQYQTIKSDSVIITILNDLRLCERNFKLIFT